MFQIHSEFSENNKNDIDDITDITNNAFSLQFSLRGFALKELYNYSYRVLRRPERWRATLFSQSTLISQLCLHCFEKLKYFTLGKMNYLL